MRSFVFAAIVSCSAIGASAAAQPTLEGAGRLEVAQACGWYAVFQCDHKSSVGGPGYVVWTSNYPNFRPGWYCRVMGPFGSQGEAAATARVYGNQGYPKSAC